jgi:conjugal transfer pilin signal peptidase TrbI
MSRSSELQSLTVSEFIERGRAFCPVLAQHIKSHAVTWLLAIAMYMLIRANYRLAINETPSLPYGLFLIHLDSRVKTGGLVAFKSHHIEPYPDGYIFVKRIVASAGDTVIKKRRDFVVGDRMLTGKEIGLSKRKLYSNDELHEGKNTIQPRKYFVAGDHEYSLDSRYDLLGLVDESDVIGRAYPIF